MRYAGTLVLTLAASCVAVDAAEDEESSETEQAVWDGEGEGETVVVQGGLDSCWAGLCWPNSWPADPGPGYTGDRGGGAGGHGGGHPGGEADPNPIPAPRECTQEPTWEQCYACCDWNSKHVWEEMCRRRPRKDRRSCWERVENELRPECYKSCNRPGGPITTVAP